MNTDDLDPERLQAFKRLYLEKLPFELLKKFANPAHVDFAVNPDGGIFGPDDHLVLRVIQSMLGQDIRYGSYEYPADWWQHFKERWFPRWWLRRWPVKMRKFRVDVRVIYPKVKLPEHEHRFFIKPTEESTE